MRSTNRMHTLRHLVLPVIGIVLGTALRVPKEIGGPEVFCWNGTTYTERWNVPASGIQWWAVAGFQSDQIAPGLPKLSCSPANTPLDQLPGLQTMCRSARTWNDIPIPFAPPPSNPPILPPFPPPPLQPVSTFRMAPNPAGLIGWSIPQQQDDNRMVWNGQSVFTCWQRPSYWACNGGPCAAGLASVRLSSNSATPGTIVEADIAMNTRTCTAGRPAWSFIEENSADSRTYSTHCAPPGSSQVLTQPTIAFADFQGVLVHEIGHLAGLGHSLVDSVHQRGEDHVPTMFIFGHGEPIPSIALSFSDQLNPCGYYTKTGLPGATSSGGVMGRANRSLEFDDLAAIGEAYPSPEFNANLGKISGTCFIGTHLSGSAGAHIVATRKDDPARIRVGTYSLSNGTFTIHGLPAGEYMVYAEPIDQAPPPFTLNGHYFLSDIVPVIAYQGTFNLPSGLNASGCLPNNVQPLFTSEFWDSAEAFNEPDAMAYGLVTVTAGSTTTGIDFCLDLNLNNGLLVGGATPSWQSPRGRVVLAQGTGYTQATLRLQPQPASSFVNAPAFVAVSPQLAEQSFNGQLLLPDLNVGSLTALQLSPAGDLSINLPINSSLGFQNLFIQAAFIDGSGAIRLSNSVNVWLPTK